MDTGRKILNLRMDRNLSQKALAAACGITPSALSKIENGANSPSAEVLKRIAKVLGTSADYLLDEEIPYPPPNHRYRPRLLRRGLDPSEEIGARITREELSFLEELRRLGPYWREIAFGVATADIETVRLLRFILYHRGVRDNLYDVEAFLDRLVAGGTDAGEGPKPAGGPEDAGRTGEGDDAS
ncbi:MAG: helix-turn-helix transcriptional regulator [Planctomycetes bacterium]|nr:helix-turn-helix transcriptional regulator [Planctomycetota bacterium]